MDQSPAAATQRLAIKKQALILAVKSGNTEATIELLDEGVPIDTKNNVRVSLLHWAASGGHVTTMRLLIRRECDVDSVDSDGLSPLHWAAANGQTKLFENCLGKERQSQGMLVNLVLRFIKQRRRDMWQLL